MASVTLEFEDVLGGEFDGGVRFTVVAEPPLMDGEPASGAQAQALDAIRFVEGNFETLRDWQFGDDA